MVKAHSRGAKVTVTKTFSRVNTLSLISMQPILIFSYHGCHTWEHALREKPNVSIAVAVVVVSCEMALDKELSQGRHPKSKHEYYSGMPP